MSRQPHTRSHVGPRSHHRINTSTDRELSSAVAVVGIMSQMDDAEGYSSAEDADQTADVSAELSSDDEAASPAETLKHEPASPKATEQLVGPMMPTDGGDVPPWANTLKSIFDARLSAAGTARPLRMASACTGLWTEATAMKAIAIHGLLRSRLAGTSFRPAQSERRF
jgi:hypothetical protein